MTKVFGRLMVVTGIAVLELIWKPLAAAPLIPVCDDCSLNMACDTTCLNTGTNEYTICGDYTGGYCQSRSPLDEPVFGDPAPDPGDEGDAGDETTPSSAHPRSVARIAADEAELFHDGNNAPFARVVVGDQPAAGTTEVDAAAVDRDDPHAEDRVVGEGQAGGLEVDRQQRELGDRRRVGDDRVGRHASVRTG